MVCYVVACGVLVWVWCVSLMCCLRVVSCCVLGYACVVVCLLVLFGVVVRLLAALYVYF